MPDEQVYFSQDKDALLRSKGFDPAMVYGKFQELGKFRNPSFSTSPLVETPIQVGSGYEYNDVNSFGEQLLNSYINQVYLTTPKGIVNFIPTVGLAIAKDNTSAAKFFDSWIKGATDFFDRGKQDVTPTESYLKSGSPLAFASSLGQGLGFVASMFAGSAVKAPAALGSFGKYAVGAAVSTPVLQSMYYEEAVNSGLDKKDAAIFSSVLAPISALSEYVGFEMMGNAITKPIISQVRKKALLEGVKEFAAKGATKAAFYDAASMSSKVYAQSMKELFSNLAVRGTRGAFAEGSQEFAQSYLEEGAKQVYDTYFAKGAQKKFGADVATNFKGAIEDAFFGGVIGAVLGGGGGAIYNPVFEESLFNVLDKAKNKEYAADKLKKDITAYVKKGKITEQEAAYGNQLVDGITNFVKTELPKTITDPIARFQALRLTDVKNDLTASLSGNPSLLPDYVPMQIERVKSALKQIGNSNTPIADFNGLLMELVQIENEVKQKNGWNEGGGNAAEDTAVETAETGIGEAVEAGGKGIEVARAAEVEPVEGVGEGVNEGVNDGVIEGASEGVNQQATLEAKKADIEKEYEKGDYQKVIQLVKDTVAGKEVNTPENLQLLTNYPKLYNKIMDIERRRQEALNKANKQIEKTNKKEDRRLKVETYRTLDIGGNPVEVEITTNADGSRLLRARQVNEDGSIEPMAYVTERINNKSQATFTNEKLIEGYIGNEDNTLQRTNVDENPNQTHIDKINAKYDAELKALGQQPTTSNQSEIEAKKADIERRRQEELKQPIKDKLQEIEKAVKTLNITIDKDGKLEQTSDEIITNIKSELDKIGLPYKEVVSNEKGSSYKVITNDGTEIEVVRLLKSGGALIKPVLSTAKFINHLIKTEPQTLRDLISNQINDKHDAEYVDAVKKGEITKEQAMQALEEVGRKGSSAYTEVAALDANQATNQAEEKPIAEQVAEYEGILTRNQDKLTKLRSSKLRKGETQEKRDAAIANLEQQESMVREKLDALKQQMPKVETPAVQSASEQIPKLEQTKVTPVAKDGKVIIDESGNLTNELQSQFEVLKEKGDAQGLNDLYSTVRIFLNGIAQSKGGKAVSQLEALKSQIEDYAKEFKEEGNAQKEEVAEKEEEKEGFTEGQELNKIYNSLKEKYGDKKGDQLYKTATRLVNPNKNTILEIRGNGVVVKEGNKYLLKPFGNTDANQNKWTLYEGIDVSDQFTKEVVSPTEQVEQPAEFEEVKQAKEKFYKHTQDKGYVEVKRAKPVYIFGTEKAFYVKEGKEFVVSDAITGAEIGRGSTLNNAVASAEENAGSVQNLESARERFTDAYGKSPYAKLQEEFSFTQSIINNAMDMADVVENEPIKVESLNKLDATFTADLSDGNLGIDEKKQSAKKQIIENGITNEAAYQLVSKAIEKVDGISVNNVFDLAKRIASNDNSPILIEHLAEALQYETTRLSGEKDAFSISIEDAKDVLLNWSKDSEPANKVRMDEIGIVGESYRGRINKLKTAKRQYEMLDNGGKALVKSFLNRYNDTIIEDAKLSTEEYLQIILDITNSKKIEDVADGIQKSVQKIEDKEAIALRGLPPVKQPLLNKENTEEALRRFSSKELSVIPLYDKGSVEKMVNAQMKRLNEVRLNVISALYNLPNKVVQLRLNKNDNVDLLDADDKKVSGRNITKQEFMDITLSVVNNQRKDAYNISEAYHKAKADGSNPELVKAVEDLLGGDNTNAYLDTMEDKGIIKRDCE